MTQLGRWLLLAGVAAAITLTAIVYSRQANEVQKTTASDVQPQQKTTPFNELKTTSDLSIQKAICTLNPSQAPAVGGVGLGMTVEKVLALFPGSNLDSEIRADLARPAQHGVTTFIVRPAKFGSKEDLTGVRNITLTFMDGHVSDMNVSYSGPEWKNVDDLVTKFSEGKNLPPIDAWEAYAGMDNQLKTLRCDGFEIRVFAGAKGGIASSVQMRDLAAEKELKDRRAKAREKAQKEARP